MTWLWFDSYQRWCKFCNIQDMQSFSKLLEIRPIRHMWKFEISLDKFPDCYNLPSLATVGVESWDLSSADLSPHLGRRADPSLKCGGEMSGNGGAFSLSCLCCSMAAANYREHSEAQPKATKQTETKLIPSRDIRLARESPFCNAARAWIRATPSSSRLTRTRRGLFRYAGSVLKWRSSRMVTWFSPRNIDILNCCQRFLPKNTESLCPFSAL